MKKKVDSEYFTFVGEKIPYAVLYQSIHRKLKEEDSIYQQLIRHRNKTLLDGWDDKFVHFRQTFNLTELLLKMKHMTLFRPLI